MNKTSFGTLEHLSGILAATTAMSLALSVFYDFAFFIALDVRLDEVPTSIADHLRTGIIWGPIVAMGSLPSLAYGWLSRVRGQGSSPSSSLAAGSDMKILLMLGVSSVAATVAYLVTGLAIAVGVVASFVWLAAVRLGLRRLGTRRHLVPEVSLAFVSVLPVALILVGAAGWHAAQTTLREEAARWLVELKIEEKQQVVAAKGVRRLTDAIVVIDDRGQVLVRPNSQIISATRVTPASSNSPLVCRWWKMNCD